MDVLPENLRRPRVGKRVGLLFFKFLDCVDLNFLPTAIRVAPGVGSFLRGCFRWLPRELKAPLLKENVPTTAGHFLFFVVDAIGSLNFLQRHFFTRSHSLYEWHKLPTFRFRAPAQKPTRRFIFDFALLKNTVHSNFIASVTTVV